MRFLQPLFLFLRATSQTGMQAGSPGGCRGGQIFREDDEVQSCRIWQMTPAIII
ncbi:hypothetical protein [uncultured Robinsoniella sp.]|uniref:hypothetical protein n=1 Tax=uncultured Robinsoniella sp. TaxID=904190 RepID=UPI00374EA257